MSNEGKLVRGITKTLDGNGGSVANNSIVQADDSGYSIISDGAGYPYAEFVLVGTFATAPTEGSVLSLLARPINVDGTLDTEVPETTRPTMWIGNFVVNNVTTQQAMIIYAKQLPFEADYYIHNNNTSQLLAAGWTLKVTPYTLGTV